MTAPNPLASHPASSHPARTADSLGNPAPPPERREVLDRAEAAAVLDATAQGAPSGFGARVEHWLGQWVADAEARLGTARRQALDHIRDVGAALTRAVALLELVVGRAGDARRERGRLVGIVAGDSPGDDGGRWPATRRSGENPRREAVKDSLLYGGAAVAEIGLNYLAFQIMGSSPIETAVLAAAIVLVNVMLPKQLGELLTRYRRAATGRGRLLAGLLVGGGLWVGVSVFVALVRTAFLLLPTGTALELGAPALLVEAGLGAELLTWGWLAVVLAVGVVVLLRAAARHNPYVDALRAAGAAVDAVEQERVDALAAVQLAQLDAHRAWESHQGLQTEFAAERDRLTGLAHEALAQYQAELDRHRANPAVIALRRSIGPARSAELDP